MIAELFRFIGEIIGVNADAMSANKTRSEAESVPFCIHSVNDLVCVNVHAVKYHCKLIHKGNVDITLAVFDDLYRLSGLYV